MADELEVNVKEFWTLLRYVPVARNILNKGRLPGLLLAVARKVASGQGLMAGLKDNLHVLQALCVAWWRGEYRQISPAAMVSIVAALLYFLSPLDALPDWIVGLGFLDDFAVLGWVMHKWAAELAAFKAWQARQSPAVQADLERLPAVDEPKAP